MNPPCHDFPYQQAVNCPVVLMLHSQKKRERLERSHKAVYRALCILSVEMRKEDVNVADSYSDLYKLIYDMLPSAAMF